MRSKQRGFTLSGTITLLAVVGFAFVMGAKLLPSYLEYFAIKKIFASMEQAGDLKGTVKEIRASFERRNAIEDVKAVRGEDLEIGKEAGETVVTANWSKRIDMVGNLAACLDFTVSSAGGQ
jgi:hypothetical protein